MAITCVDRISELPHPIRQQILSLISQKDAAKICVLSKLWLHHWYTRPNVEFRQRRFNRQTFEHLVNETFQRYHEQNLPILEFRLLVSRMYDSKPAAELLGKWIPKLKIFNIYLLHDENWCNFNILWSVFEAKSLEKLYLEGWTLDQKSVPRVLFKHLKTLHLVEVEIADETLKQIISSCPLIESITFDNCSGLSANNFDIPASVFEAESIQQLYLERCTLDQNWVVNVLCKHLKTLHLTEVDIADENFKKIISSCPLIESVTLNYCRGLITTIKVDDKQLRNLKHFEFTTNHGYGRPPRIEFDIPSSVIENIIISCCPVWFRNDQYQRNLKSLSLTRVRLSSELFDLFSCNNMPRLEFLELVSCCGFKEFHLSSRSIKHLVYHIEPKLNPRKMTVMRATIDAPNLLYFDYSSYYPPPVFSFISSHEWKSKVSLKTIKDSSWFLMLYQLLKGLSGSEISLFLYNIFPPERKSEDKLPYNNNQPVVVEHLELWSPYPLMPSRSDFMKLFGICQPRALVGYEKTEDFLSEFLVMDTRLKKGTAFGDRMWRM